MRDLKTLSRRDFFGASTALLGLSLLPGALWAEELFMKTPRQTEGPFYPDKLPLDTDNDLLIVQDRIDRAVGQVTHISGQVLDIRGAPIKNALVEIWQCNAFGQYVHTADAGRGKADPNFQGYGRFETGRKGEYYFRTIKPVSYGWRAPHIHFAVTAREHKHLTTQMYVAGASENRWDTILNSIPDPRARNSLIVPFKPAPDSKIEELMGAFNIILG